MKYSDPSGHAPVLEMGEGGADLAYVENPVGWMLNLFNKLDYDLTTKEKARVYDYFISVEEAATAWALDQIGAKGSKTKTGCNCFTAGTKVLTDEGEKNIEDIEVGDKVLAKDENNPDGELAYKEVTALYRNQRDDIIKLFVGDQVIQTTDNHPFWVEGKGWVFADELQAGDKLQKADGSNLTIDKVEFDKLDEPVTVYNFTVADYHTYYVTDIGIWVHNTNCGDKGKPEATKHSNYRKTETGRPVGVVVNDIQRARTKDILIQDNGNIIVRGNNGRVHVLSPDGQRHITTLNRTDKNVQALIRQGKYNYLTEGQAQHYINMYK